MESASSASGSGQQHVKRSATDAEPEAPIEVPMEMGTGKRVALPSALAATTIRKLAEKSSTVVITTQTGTDGYREKAMRIASVEQVELGNIMELSVTGHVFK